MKTVVLPRNEAATELARLICCTVSKKENAVIGLGLGYGYKDVFSALVQMIRTMQVSLSEVRILELCAYYDSERSDFHDNINFLLDNSDLNRNNVIRLSEDVCAEFDSMLIRLGGFDLSVTEIGSNGALGFNNPGSEYSSTAGKVRLFTASRKEKADYFGCFEKVPQYVFTAGINAVVNARTVIGIAFGEENADAVFKTAYARNDGIVPAAYLQLCSSSFLFADTLSGSKL